MALSPWATAPLRSIAACSATTTFRSRPQYLDSNAAPQPAKPPPTIRMSQSTIFGAAGSPSSILTPMSDYGGTSGVRTGSSSMARYVGSKERSSLESAPGSGGGSVLGDAIVPHLVFRIG